MRKHGNSYRQFITMVTALAVLLFGTSAFAGIFDFLDKNGTDEVSQESQDPISQLKGPARAEVNAIANLLLPGSGLMAIDLTQKSGQFCMLDAVSGHNMVHFSRDPGKDAEDVLYFINPETFIQSGLKVETLPPLPHELGQMKSHQWYYYDGSYVEPHHGRKMGKEFLVMAIDVK